MPARFNRTPVILTALLLTAGLAISVFSEKGDTLMYLNGLHTAWSDRFFYVVTNLGGALPYWIVAIGLLFIRKRYAVAVVATGLVNMLASSVLKTAWGLPRPYTWMSETRQELLTLLNPVEHIELYHAYNSFPSGHTLAAFTLFGFLAMIARHVVLQVSAIFVAALVGISRIYLHLHFLEDVLFGALCGMLLGISGYWAQDIYLRGKTFWDTGLRLQKFW